ncbi:PIG-L family deacetylase [Planctomicrobium sp. SH527]|uniref:PIG-L family deacetylase n=1 Tax=Planctomicrobium sp. SH527 TaxID=3448123 RepID=UPI003F5C63B3
MTSHSEKARVSLPEPLDVIAVGAHPDDVEVAVGGTLAKLAKQGYRVGIVDLTDGEPTPKSPGPEHRLQEAKKAAEILGVQVRLTLPLPNRRLFDSFEARVMLAKVFRQYRPKIVLGIADKTPLASPDHWQAMQITDAAVFYSRLTKWDGEFDGLPVHTINQLLWYKLGFGTDEPIRAAGTMIVDISDTLDLKIESVKAYESQFPANKERIFQLIESQARLLGLSAGLAAGEMLIAPKPVVVKDLIHSFAAPELPRTNLDPSSQVIVQ